MGVGEVCLLSSAFLIPSVCAARVSVEGRVDRTTITVGDPVTYTLTIRRAERDRLTLPPMGAQLGDLEVRDVKRSEVRKAEGGIAEEVAEYILTSYAVGTHEIPALSVGYVTASGDTGHVLTNSIRIAVQSVIKQGEEKTLKDVKPPVELVAGLPWWVYLLLVLALAGILACVLYRRRRQSGPKVLREAPPKPIDELEEFDKIAAMGLLARGEYKQHYILVSDAMRRYIERRYRIEAMERTTWEIVSEMKQTRLEPPTLALFDDFLSTCDLVKFAKYIPPPEEMEGVIDRAKDIVRVTMILPERVETQGASALAR